MFDKLIESEPEGADFKNRRRYFMVSSVVVGILFTTAVVISIYAADIGLGSASFELSEIMAPAEMAAIEPEAPQPRTLAATSQSQSQIVSRQVNMASVNEPTIVPETTSTAPNTQASRPITGNYLIGAKLDSNTGVSGGSGRNNSELGPNSGLSSATQVTESEKDPEPPPPPAIKEPKVKRPVSIGVINGKATYLPKPIYSAAAIAVRAEGKVDVQVMIDENGKVISANAVSGHPMLRSAAEQAARNAKFTPTYLSKVAVKVTGVIVYNFSR